MQDKHKLYPKPSRVRFRGALGNNISDRPKRFNPKCQHTMSHVVFKGEADTQIFEKRIDMKITDNIEYIVPITVRLYACPSVRLFVRWSFACRRLPAGVRLSVASCSPLSSSSPSCRRHRHRCCRRCPFVVVLDPSYIRRPCAELLSNLFVCLITSSPRPLTAADPRNNATNPRRDADFIGPLRCGDDFVDDNVMTTLLIDNCTSKESCGTV